LNIPLFIHDDNDENDEHDHDDNKGGVKRYETSTDDESMSCGDKPALSSSYPG